MFRRLARYAEDDAFVRLVFDHLQNLGVILLVLGAAAWKQKHLGAGSSSGGVAPVAWDVLGTLILGVLGLGLLWLNLAHLFHRLRGHQLSRPLKFFIGLLYGVILGSLLRYAADGKT